MKCFNHPDREAVATCQNCGKGLCRECAEKHTPCLCDSCAAQLRQDEQELAKSKEEQRKQKYKDALVDSRGEFIKTAVIGVVVGFLITWFMASEHRNNYGFGACAGMFVMCFFIPFGWKFLTYLQSFFPISLFGTFWFWFIYIIVKGVLSVFVGIPAFVYQLVKTVLTQRKINELK